MMRYTNSLAAMMLCALSYSQGLATADETTQGNTKQTVAPAVPPKAGRHAVDITKPATKGAAKKTAETAAEIEKRYALEVIELTNRERKKAGLAPLKPQADLTHSAAWLARDMADNKYFSHTDSKGRSISPRLPDFGYSDYSMIGENIAAGQESPAAVVAGWMKSPGHRANILAPEFREIGVAYFAKPGTKFRKYWVQDFGTPASSRD